MAQVQPGSGGGGLSRAGVCVCVCGVRNFTCMSASFCEGKTVHGATSKLLFKYS